MGVAERRIRDRERLRAHIVDVARDLLLEQGLAGLSMRAIADRIEYSVATLYLYFRDKDELVRAVVDAGFERMSAVVTSELERAGPTASWAIQYSAMGRAYARFALENPAFFKVMFELPPTAELDQAATTDVPRSALGRSEDLIRLAVGAGEFSVPDARRTAVIGWGLVHGLTTLYLAGHLRDEAPGPEAFMRLIDDAMRTAYQGWRPEGSGGEEM